MITRSSRNWRVLALAVLAIVVILAPIKHGDAAETGQAIFEDQCSACHSIGKGKLVGPDLAGVTLRREEGWLKRQIKDPERLIEEEDPIALQLLKESDDVPMATLELSDEDVASVIAYLKSIENQASVATSLPSQYVPTVLLSVVVLAGLTLIGLRAGNKKVDVR